MNKRLKKIILKTKKQVYGDRLGNTPSLFQGEGFEFAELREYLYGDDVRKIDWKSTAKLGKPFVKIYREERELNVAVVSMLGGSTYFGTVQQKSEVIAQIVGILGFSAIKNSDRFTHLLFADRLYEMIPPSKKFFAVQRAIEANFTFDPIGKKSDFVGLVSTLNQRLKRRTLLFILSDFIGEIDLKLLSKKHDLVIVIVRDRFEENPKALGTLRLIDMESRKSFEGSVDDSRLKAYTQALEENDERLYRMCKKLGIRFVKIYTDEEPYVKLMKRMH